MIDPFVVTSHCQDWTRCFVDLDVHAEATQDLHHEEIAETFPTKSEEGEQLGQISNGEMRLFSKRILQMNRFFVKEKVFCRDFIIFAISEFPFSQVDVDVNR